MSTEVRRKHVRVGELLLRYKLITDEQLQHALTEQKRTGRKLGRVLTDLGYISEQAFHEVLARYLGDAPAEGAPAGALGDLTPGRAEPTGVE